METHIESIQSQLFKSKLTVTGPFVSSGGYTLTGTGTVGAGLTLTSPTLTTPAITGGTLTTTTISGAIMADEKVLAASQTIDASTTLATITGFSWTVVAGATYVFDVELPITCTTNAGIAVGFGLTTATLTSIRYNFYVSTAADNSTAVSGTGTTATSGTKIINTKTAAYTMARVSGSMVVNAGGTFAFQAAQETSGTGGDVTVILIGSRGKLRRVA